MASYKLKVDLIFGEKGIVRGALKIWVDFWGICRASVYRALS